MSMLHHLLVFDAWIDLVKSPTGEMLVESLAESPHPEEQRLGRMISQCERSLPQDTDAWIRLFMSSVSELDQISVLICDATLPTCPILSANQGFQIMTGYEREEAIGKSCRFLQGPSRMKGQSI